MLRTIRANTEFIELAQPLTLHSLTENQRKKIANEIIKEVSCIINNTPTVCKKNYIDNKLINMFIENPKKYKK